jgi:hypothetical protein
MSLSVYEAGAEETQREDDPERPETGTYARA